MGRYDRSIVPAVPPRRHEAVAQGRPCETAKCADRAPRAQLAPGMHGWRRGRRSDYGVRLREKQKVKRYYGVCEQAVPSGTSTRPSAARATPARCSCSLLERRLDNVVYKLGFAASRKAARQLIAHGHIRVNGRKVDVRSFLVQVGDKITVKGSRQAA